MDDDLIDSCISLIGSKGSPADICTLYTRLSDKLEDRIIEFELTSRQFISGLLDIVNDDGSFPFKFKSSNPKSVLYTATGLDILYETNVVENSILEKIIDYLLSVQDVKGWWKDNSDLLSVNNLPFYQDPMDASVRIFNTASIGSILVKFSQNEEVKNALNKSMEALKSVITTNRALIGFPQSTVYATPIFADYFGLDSNELTQHLEVLNTMLSTSSKVIGDVITIGEQTLIAGVSTTHSIITTCIEMLMEKYSETTKDGLKIGGWKQYNQYDPSLTMRALVLLLNTS